MSPGCVVLACAALVVGGPARSQGHEHGGAGPPGRAGDDGGEPGDDLPPPPRGPPLPPPTWPRPPPAPEDALGRDEAREASGTAWQPLDTPHRAAHVTLGAATLMLHGNLFLAYTDQGGPRGASEAFAASWYMAMARLPVGGGALALRAMASLDPFTMKREGYPELLQTGEAAGGAPLHDRQHPHDLWMELAALGRAPLGRAAAVELYAALVGEPALGPVAFPHRASALHDPVAPLAHHWLDSTHLSAGVLTAALALRDLKLEGSWFNGREPDERRKDLETPHLDSWALRATLAPVEELALQASYGRLASPEALFPAEALHRVTASALWNERIGRAGNAAFLVAWGRNLEGGRADDALLAEGTWDRDGHDAFFARLEWVEKSARDLAATGRDPEERFGVVALGLGFVHSVGPVAGLMPGVGARFAIHDAPGALAPLYGGRSPVGVLVFLQLLPAMSEGAAHGEHAGHVP
jgi:hypothetical protein